MWGHVRCGWGCVGSIGRVLMCTQHGSARVQCTLTRVDSKGVVINSSSEPALRRLWHPAGLPSERGR